MKPLQAQVALELSTLFAKAEWTPADENFKPRPFVTWKGFFSVSGTPPGGQPCATSCRTADEVLAFLEAGRRPEPVTVDTPEAAAVVNAAPEGPRVYPETDPALERERARADAAEARAAELERRLAALEPTPLPPNPTEAKLSDYGIVGATPDVATDPILTPEEANAEANRLFANFKEGFDVGDEISGLSEVRREDLTAALNRRKSKMRRERMTGALPDREEEEAIDTLVNLLAKRGI